MLYYLFHKLTPYFSPLNLFEYITFRAAAAAFFSFALCVGFGPFAIRKLRDLKVGQHIRKEEAPDLHALHGKKSGTPTMGGALFIPAAMISTLLWADIRSTLAWVAVFATAYLAALGFIDDYIKLTRKRSLGLRGWWKFGGQIVLGLLVGLYLYLVPLDATYLRKDSLALSTGVPFFKEFFIHFGLLYIPFAALVIVGSSNAVNLTDGLDGLASGSWVMAGLAYTAMAYIVSRNDWSDFLYIIHVAGAHELTIFCAALVGAVMGFLWYNVHPAQMFMGDTGSLALGGALGTVAILIKQELLLVIVGGLFVVEALSVIIQVLSFKLRGGKRVFRMAPIHHHFELMGWTETQVTVRFWIVAAIFALLALSTLKIR